MAKNTSKKSQHDLVATAAAIPGMIAAGVSSAIDAGVSTAKDAISDLQGGRKRSAPKATTRKRAPKRKTSAKSSSAKS